jgi:hypothetical protein
MRRPDALRARRIKAGNESLRHRLSYATASSSRMYSITASLQPSICVHAP